VKILVTGGTGFLGAHLVRTLARSGYFVRVIARTPPVSASERPGDPSGNRSNFESLSGALENIEFLQGDLANRELVRRAVSGVEVIYHLAGLVSFDPKDGRRMYQLHVDYTRDLLQAANEAGVRRIVLASTSGTIAVSKEERIGVEGDEYPLTLVGRWPYYLSKIYQEKIALQFCRERSMPLVVLNPGLLLGPGDERLSSTWIVAKFLNRDIPTMPRGGLCFVDVRDAAKAFAAAISAGELYGRHLMGINMPFTKFFARLERLTGVPAPKLRLPLPLSLLGAQLLERWAKARGVEPPIDRPSVEIGDHFYYVDSSKSERLLDFKARDPQETLLDTVRSLFFTMPPGSVPGTKARLREARAKGG
jgi:dihydroflavonol-4-reductase